MEWSVSQSVSQSQLVSQSVSRPVGRSVGRSVRPSVRPSVSQSVSQSVSLSVSQSVSRSASLPSSLSIGRSDSQSVTCVWSFVYIYASQSYTIQIFWIGQSVIVLACISNQKEQTSRPKLTDAEVQLDVDVQILLICTKLVLHLALVGACIVLQYFGDNMSNANLVSVGTYYVLLRYWTAKTVCKTKKLYYFI